MHTTVFIEQSQEHSDFVLVCTFWHPPWAEFQNEVII